MMTGLNPGKGQGTFTELYPRQDASGIGLNAWQGCPASVGGVQVWSPDQTFREAKYPHLKTWWKMGFFDFPDLLVSYARINFTIHSQGRKQMKKVIFYLIICMFFLLTSTHAGLAQA